ncbi:L-fucose:H+ symporter permease [Pedobacter sp. SYP-B3415]|uniref:L-fucose:H+ symporter permease n=1 Tax=Pedobacter sp. SYP-B3415 TaxID=2496641 RepID=UPI00101DC28A|nr:L-fucose:H+ symporter permease [Pedobacter sp. SYP-B3415]
MKHAELTDIQPVAVHGRAKYLLPFTLVICLFFLWGMAHNLDSVLIPHLKKACNLNNTQSALIDTAVFAAYFLMAIPAGMILKRWGYKTSMIAGLLVFALGAFLFVPAANGLSYLLFLVALFVIGCGLTLLETSANPYAAVLGPPEQATSRLNLAASFNGLASVVAPVVGSLFILSGTAHSQEALAAMPEAERTAYFMSEAASVKLPYIVLGSVLLTIAIVFSFIRFPEIRTKNKDGIAGSGFFNVLRHRHLRWAVVAQFFYVGAQVCVTSFFIRMAQQGAGLDEKSAAYYLGIYGALFTAGRFAGTALLQFVRSNQLLAIYALISLLLCAIAIFSQGLIVIYALGAIGFFMSVMFPTIFALGIAGLGDDTKPGSSWLIMSIVGGAILPLAMGTLIDLNGDRIQAGYFIPAVCFIFVFLFALRGYKIVKPPVNA